MHTMKKLKLAAIAATTLFGTVAVSAVTTAAHAVPLRISVTNTSQSNLSLTPLYFGFHDGSVDLFNVGETASAGIEDLAETGMFGMLRDERLAMQGDSQGGALTAPGSPFTTMDLPPVIEPGETSTVIIDVDSSNRFFSFFSMILASNDTFIGQDNAQANEVFDVNGNVISQTINVNGFNLYDAGTEVNDFANGPAFVPGQDINAGIEEGGTVQLSSGLGLLDMLTIANGLTISPELVDFVNNRAGFNIATITVSEVPLPGAVIPMVTGLIALGAAKRRKKQKTA